MQQAEDRGVPGEDLGGAFARWVVAALLAGAALVGLMILVGIVAYALRPPDWVPTVLGVVLAVGTAGFAWLLASAFRSKKR